MNDCHANCDRCDGCGAHILPDEARWDVPALAPADDHEFHLGDRAYHFHFDCDPQQWDHEGPHHGCREFAGVAQDAYSQGMHRVRGCVRWEEVTR